MGRFVRDNEYYSISLSKWDGKNDEFHVVADITGQNSALMIEERDTQSTQRDKQHA